MVTQITINCPITLYCNHIIFSKYCNYNVKIMCDLSGYFNFRNTNNLCNHIESFTVCFNTNAIYEILAYPNRLQVVSSFHIVRFVWSYQILFVLLRYCSSSTRSK